MCGNFFVNFTLNVGRWLELENENHANVLKIWFWHGDRQEFWSTG